MTPPDWLREVGSGRVVIRVPNWLGDAMFAIPLVRALRRWAPPAELVIQARPAVGEVLAALEGVADCVIPAGGAGPRDLLTDARRLRGASVAILLPHSFASALPAKFAGVTRRVGFATHGRSLLLTDAVLPPPRPLPPALHYGRLVGGEVDLADAGVKPTATALARGRARSGSARWAVLAPGAAFGSAKRWGTPGFRAVAKALRALGLRPLVVGSRDERELAERCGGVNLAGRTSGSELVGLLAGAAVAVVNDSGVLHVASALGTRLVAIFGATDPAATGPLGTGHRILFRPAPCTPCGLRECSRPRHECMDDITPELVIGEVERALKLAGDLP